MQGSGYQRSCYHSPEAGARKHPIDRKTKGQGRVPAFGAADCGEEGLLQRLQSFSRGRRDANDGGVRQKTALKLGAYVLFYHIGPVAVDQIALRERDHAVLDIEQAQDVEMFARLRHDALIGSDDQQDHIDSTRAGQHVFKKALVSGHIYDADNRPIRKLERCKTDIDGHAALLFFFQTIRIYASEGFDEGGLAMIDMACRSDDDMLHSREGSMVPEGST